MLIKKSLISISFLLLSLSASAGPFCNKYNNSSIDKQIEYTLHLIDSLMKDWPEHDRLKLQASHSERLAFTKGTAKDIKAACKEDNDFSAGITLGAHVGNQQALYFIKRNK